jgi:hypothetical protein
MPWHREDPWQPLSGRALGRRDSWNRECKPLQSLANLLQMLEAAPTGCQTATNLLRAAPVNRKPVTRLLQAAPIGYRFVANRLCWCLPPTGAVLGFLEGLCTVRTCSELHWNGTPPKTIISDQNHLALRVRHTQALGGGLSSPLGNTPPPWWSIFRG